MTQESSTERPRTLRDRLNYYVPLLLSLVPTPVLLLISSSSDIYVKNQGLLQYQYQVLAPFAVLSVLTILIGFVLSVLSQHLRGFRPLVWAYYLSAPVFLLFAFFRGLQDTLSGLSILYQTSTGLLFWPVLLVVIALVFSRWQPSLEMIRGFAAFAIILLAYEGGTLFYHVLTNRGPTVPGLETLGTPSNEHLPNIYHLVFDAYQTDLLEHTLTDETRRALGGLTYFPNNQAEWADTPTSMATIFSGRDYYYDRPSARYLSEAFTTEASFLYWLKSLKYQTVAYIPNGWVGSKKFFDRVVQHNDAALDDILPLNMEAFWNLWLFSNTPAALRDSVLSKSWFSDLDETDMKLLQNGRLLPTSTPVTSSLAFRKMMEEEKSLPASGRYTLVHVIIPHYPLKLEADCSYSIGNTRTEPLEQAQCALKLITEYLDLLKDLGRFENSLILIHGDHGGPYRTQDGELVTMARSRSLDAVLMVKPVGTPAGGELQILDLKTTLIMLPTIIMSSVTDAISGNPQPDPWTPRRAVVPRVEEEILESAERILNRNGFSLGKVKRVPDDRHPEDVVVAQEPPAFTTDVTAEEVSLVVSSGPSSEGPQVMPNFVGRNVTEVTEWLEERHLPTSKIHPVDHAVAPGGMVVTQIPRAGTRVNQGAEVSFYVAK